MNLLTVAAYLIAALVSVLFIITIKRLFLSPIAGIPGPRLAAVSRWYETYYDAICGGQYMYKILRLHQRYGPVVRISPNEVHINSPDFYNTLYAGPTRRRHKDSWFLSSMAPGTSFAAANFDHHRLRRGALSPFFSKQAIRALEPVINEKMHLLCDHARRAQRSGCLLELHTCFINLAVDIVSQYTFGRDNGFDTLQAPVLNDKWKKGVNGIFEMILVTRHFPWLYSLSRVLPVWLSAWICPTFKYINTIEKVSRS